MPMLPLNFSRHRYNESFWENAHVVYIPWSSPDLLEHRYADHDAIGPKRQPQAPQAQREHLLHYLCMRAPQLSTKGLCTVSLNVAAFNARVKDKDNVVPHPMSIADVNPRVVPLVAARELPLLRLASEESLGSADCRVDCADNDIEGYLTECEEVVDAETHRLSHLYDEISRVIDCMSAVPARTVSRESLPFVSRTLRNELKAVDRDASLCMTRWTEVHAFGEKLEKSVRETGKPFFIQAPMRGIKPLFVETFDQAQILFDFSVDLAETIRTWRTTIDGPFYEHRGGAPSTSVRRCLADLVAPLEDANKALRRRRLMAAARKWNAPSDPGVEASAQGNCTSHRSPRRP